MCGDRTPSRRCGTEGGEVARAPSLVMSPSPSRRLGCSLGLLLLCLGTTALAQEREAGYFLRLQTPTQDVSVQVSPESIVGSDVRLVRDEKVVRGRASGRSVFLRLTQGQLDGLMGAQPLRLTSSEQEGGSLLEGTLLGAPVDLEFGPKQLTGSVGPCTYDLEYRDEAYVGVRTCGPGERQPVYVFLTPGLPEQVPPMLTLALAVLLGT